AWNLQSQAPTTASGTRSPNGSRSYRHGRLEATSTRSPPWNSQTQRIVRLGIRGNGWTTTFTLFAVTHQSLSRIGKATARIEQACFGCAPQNQFNIRHWQPNFFSDAELRTLPQSAANRN